MRESTLTGQAQAHQLVLAWLVHRIGQITPYEESQAKFNELAEALSKDATYPRTIRDAAVDELSLIRGLKPVVSTCQIGSLPYGYRIGEDGRPVIDPVEGPVVQRIFRAYVQEDKGVPTILQELTPDEAPLRKGSKWGSWSSSQIHRMLGAEVYIGT